MAVARKIHDFMEQGSWIRKIFEEGIVLSQKYGADNVFDLSLGNPVIEPPEEFFDELRRIADDPAPGNAQVYAQLGLPGDPRGGGGAAVPRRRVCPSTLTT